MSICAYLYILALQNYTSTNKRKLKFSLCQGKENIKVEYLQESVHKSVVKRGSICPVVIENDSQDFGLLRRLSANYTSGRVER